MRRAALAIWTAVAACSGGEDHQPPDSGAPPIDARLDPLEHLVPTAERVLSPGNTGGQDEDPTILRASDGRLYLAWYSNRNGAQPDGLPDREIFLVRSDDGATWTDPPVQLTRSLKFSFYPSLAQDDAGTFHLAYWRMIPLPEGCVLDVNCTGADSRIMYKRSTAPEGTAWDVDGETTLAGGPGDWLPSLVVDRAGHRLLVYFSSPARAADGHVDVTDGTLRIYVVVNDGSGWSGPRRLVGVNPDDSHNTYPHVVQKPGGQFLMTWTRYARSAGVDPLVALSEPSTETMRATSSDGITWQGATVISAGGAVDVLPSLFADEGGATWNVLWITTLGAATGRTVEMAETGTYPAGLVDRPEIAGYSGSILATPTPGVYWGVWVSGDQGKQKIRYRYFKRER